MKNYELAEATISSKNMTHGNDNNGANTIINIYVSK